MAQDRRLNDAFDDLDDCEVVVAVEEPAGAELVASAMNDLLDAGFHLRALHAAGPVGVLGRWWVLVGLGREEPSDDYWQRGRPLPRRMLAMTDDT